jgi:ketosteroid isomerase-like protein
MRRYWMIALVVCLFVGINGQAQKKNGVVYSEHETIDKTRDMWKTFLKGDYDGFQAYLADSVKVFVNGKKINVTPEGTKNYVDWYKDNFVNLKIVDHKPAYPDAIKYKNGEVWVQDWVKMTGIHKETGVKLDLPRHHMYQFNKDGKISLMAYYHDPQVFEEIRNSKSTIENGKVFINHPCIVTVRKTVNAFENQDLDAWASFFSDDAMFGSSARKFGDLSDKKTHMAAMKESRFFKPETKFKIEQIGYPDCVYYAKGDTYVVYSWWLYKEKGKDGMLEVPYMLSSTFNKDGKISREFVWYSASHFDQKKK